MAFADCGAKSGGAVVCTAGSLYRAGKCAVFPLLSERFDFKEPGIGDLIGNG